MSSSTPTRARELEDLLVAHRLTFSTKKLFPGWICKTCGDVVADLSVRVFEAEVRHQSEALAAELSGKG